MPKKGEHNHNIMKNYTLKKKENQHRYKLVKKHLSEKSVARFNECGNKIEFFGDEKLQRLKVHRAYFCENRFCPTCAWRKSVKDATKVSVLMDYLEAEHKKAFIFLTLTAPNVKAADLKAEIARFGRAFKALLKRNEVKAMCKGFIRKLEVTYNKERDDYHPHFHCVLAVNASYFDDKTYIKQSRWLDLWRSVMNDQLITQVDVRRVKRVKDANEIAKYSVKDTDMAFSERVFDVFYENLKGQQLLTFGGLFAEAHKKYKAKELEDYKAKDETEYVWLVLMCWHGKNYIQEQQRRLETGEYHCLKKDSEHEFVVA